MTTARACLSRLAAGAAAAKTWLVRSTATSPPPPPAARLVRAALCAALLLALGATTLRALLRESDAARASSGQQLQLQHQQHHHQAAAAAAAAAYAAAAQRSFEAERAYLGGGARVAVDRGALAAARECGDERVAALARDLERAVAGGWPLAAARAQMRAALDLASAAALAREAAAAEAQDEEERLEVEERFAAAAEAAAAAAAAEAEAEAAARQQEPGSEGAKGAKGRRRKEQAAAAAATKRQQQQQQRRRRQRRAAPVVVIIKPPDPPRRIVREHRRGWQFAQRATALLAERAAEAVGSLAPIPCGDGGGGDPTLPGPPKGQRSLVAVTMARDLDSGVGARFSSSSFSGAAGAGGGGGGVGRDGPSAAASARNAAWQTVRLAAGTAPGRLAVSVAVLLERVGEQEGQEEDGSGASGGATKGKGRGRASSKAPKTAAQAAAAAQAAQAAERAGHLRAAAALLRLALAPLGVDCRAAELRDDARPSRPTAAAAAAANATILTTAAAAPSAAAAAATTLATTPIGGPQAPFVGRGAALARNAAVDAFFPAPPLSRGGGGGDSNTSSSSFAPDAVLFADARAFFCAEDALRLLSYPTAGIDLTCALPLVEDPPPAPSEASSAVSAFSSVSLFAAAPPVDGGAAAGPDITRDPLAEEAARAHPDVPSRLRLRSLRADGAADAARDVRGSALSPLPPFLVHADSAALVRQGQPAPARCCWGGLARLSAWPLRRGLRFRAGAADGACARPYHEASALCADLHRLSAGGAVTPDEEEGGGGGGGGSGAAAAAAAAADAAAASTQRGPARALLDPAVRTSPQARVRRVLAHRRFPYYYYTRMELGARWRLDVAPLLREEKAGGGGGAVFWPAPGKPAVGGMWQPTMQKVACCEAPVPGVSDAGAWRPSLAADCRPVRAARATGEEEEGAEGDGGGGLGGLAAPPRNATRAFFEACERRARKQKRKKSKKRIRSRDDDEAELYCPGAALELARGQQQVGR